MTHFLQKKNRERLIPISNDYGAVLPRFTLHCFKKYYRRKGLKWAVANFACHKCFFFHGLSSASILIITFKDV